MHPISTPTTLRLSQEELLLVLQALGLRRLPGMGQAQLASGEQPGANVLLEAAERALFARGLVRIEQGTARLDRSLVAAATVCAHPDQMVALFDQCTDRPATRRFFYRVPELAVCHSFPHAGLHDLELASDGDMGAAALDELLAELPEGSLTTESYALPEALLGELQQEQTAPDALAALPVEQARLLQQSLQRPRLRLLLQLVYRVAPEVEQRVLVVLACAQQCWLVQRGAPGLLMVQGVSSEQAAVSLATAHGPLRVPMPPVFEAAAAPALVQP